MAIASHIAGYCAELAGGLEGCGVELQVDQPEDFDVKVLV